MSTLRTGAPISRDDATALVMAALRQVAPDVDEATVAGDADWSETLGLDSFDFMCMIELVAERAGIAVPPRCYPQVATVDGLVDHVVAARART